MSMSTNNDLHGRLEKIEGQLKQIKIFLAILIVIVLIGLPGVFASIVNRTAELGLAGVLFILPILVGAYVIFWLFDLFFLRKPREKRERMMEERMQEEISKFQAEQLRIDVNPKGYDLSSGSTAADDTGKR